MNGVRLGEVLLHGTGNFVGGSRPDLDEFLAALGVGDQTALVLLLHLARLFLRRSQKLSLGRRGDDVGEGDSDTRTRRPTEPERLELIERFGDLHLGVALGKSVDRGTQEFLIHLIVHEGVVRRQCLVEQGPPKRCDEGEGLSASQPSGTGHPCGGSVFSILILTRACRSSAPASKAIRASGHTRVRGSSSSPLSRRSLRFESSSNRCPAPCPGSVWQSVARSPETECCS